MVYLALLVGGVIGGMLRYVVSLIPAGSAFPMDILVINLTGSFILGAFYGLANVRPIPDWIRIGFGTGVIGSFTTFSTFCVGADSLTHVDYAVIYIIVSAVGGPLLAYIGDLAVMVYARRNLGTASGEEASV